MIYVIEYIKSGFKRTLPDEGYSNLYIGVKAAKQMCPERENMKFEVGEEVYLKNDLTEKLTVFQKTSQDCRTLKRPDGSSTPANIKDLVSIEYLIQTTLEEVLNEK